ncbi:wd repeat domain 60 [Anaeramoeba flamelloides]|uniref:Wd repeat domain 60 n=1 Tax=Anaeramoeba flamelloides TaxID=1746091 RepID=A0ABQ8YN27_9EUKA|nr:wd repeat domain 60 [Anaeramoeba flamelloides]
MKSKSKPGQNHFVNYIENEKTNEKNNQKEKEKEKKKKKEKQKEKEQERQKSKQTNKKIIIQNPQTKNKKYKRKKKEVIRPLDAPDGWEKWCYEKKKAYSMYSQNPNSYYFRFNEKGDQEKFGPFSKEEEQLFKERLRKYGSGVWGLFSMVISGRCGYICANFFRKKLIEDPLFFKEFGKDYKIINGKLVFQGEKRCRPNTATRENQRNEAIIFRKLWQNDPETNFNKWVTHKYPKNKFDNEHEHKYADYTQPENNNIKKIEINEKEIKQEQKPKPSKEKENNYRNELKFETQSQDNFKNKNEKELAIGDSDLNEKQPKKKRRNF